MTLNPYPMVVTESGDASDAPEGAQPVALYGVQAGGGDGSGGVQIIEYNTLSGWELVNTQEVFDIQIAVLQFLSGGWTRFNLELRADILDLGVFTTPLESGGTNGGTEFTFQGDELEDLTPYGAAGEMFLYDKDFNEVFRGRYVAAAVAGSRFGLPVSMQVAWPLITEDISSETSVYFTV